MISGADTSFDFELKDAATGKEVHDIEPWLGAWAHVIIVSADRGDFIHAHPYKRIDAQNCAREVVFPELNIRQALPAGEA
jgi:hypothetical protein